MKKSLPLSLISVSLLSLVLASYLMIREAKITVVYGDWKEAIAKTYMLKYILEEKMGVKVKIKKASIEEMWKGIAEGKYDAMLCADRPDQQAFYDKYKLAIVDFGPNWMDEKKTVHTIVRKGLQGKRPALARFLNNFCLGRSKLESVVALIQNGMIPKVAGLKWIQENYLDPEIGWDSANGSQSTFGPEIGL
jgi:ABC-type proline/glycine betaine transport system substrate-binding protein